MRRFVLAGLGGGLCAALLAWSGPSRPAAPARAGAETDRPDWALRAAAPVGVSGSTDVVRWNRATLRAVPAYDGGEREPDRGGAPAQRDEMLWAFDFQTHSYYRLRAARVLQSRHSVVYVETGLELPPGTVESLASTFEDDVHPAILDAFGPALAPRVGREEAATILLLDIRDPLFHQASPHTYFTGYFDPVNQRLQSDLDRENPRAKSNEREMIYVDASAPTASDGMVIRQTLAHEWAHLVQWFHDPEDHDWLVEGLSELAVHLSGLGHPREHVLAFLDDPNGSLVTWDGEPRDYGKVYLFLLYLHEQVGESDRWWLRRLVANPADGIGSLSVTVPLDRPLGQLLRDFVLALHLDDQGLAGGRYGFRSLDLMPGPRLPEAFPAPRLARRSLRDADRLVTELGPWAMRSEAYDAEWNGLDIEFWAYTPLCVGAARKPVLDDADVRVDCPRDDGLIVWGFEGPPRASVPSPVIVAVANGTDLPTELTLAVMPIVSAQTVAFRAFLPTALSAR